MHGRVEDTLFCYCGRNFGTRQALGAHVGRPSKTSATAKIPGDKLAGIKAMASVECREKLTSCRFCGKVDPVKNIAAHVPFCKQNPNYAKNVEQFRQRRLSQFVSEETRRKHSIAQSRRLEELGGSGFKHVKYYEVRNIQDQVFLVRGLLEKRIAEKLNTERRLWVRRIYLDYIDDHGQLRRYTPDFYLPHENIYIEAKGYFSAVDATKLERVFEYNDLECLMIIFRCW